MIELKHKVGDKVLVKDLEWYNKNKNENDEVIISALGPVFTRSHSKYAGRIMTVGVVSKLGFYVLKEDREGNRWYDEMFDAPVEAETKPAPKFKVGDKVIFDPYPCVVTDVTWRDSFHGFIYTVGGVDFEKKAREEDLIFDTSEDRMKELRKMCTISLTDSNYSDKVEVLLNDYEYTEEGGKSYFVKKKKRYPDTYEECCKVLGVNADNFISIRNLYRDDGDEELTDYEGVLLEKFDSLWELIICRDAYWKIAGEELGLEGPWEPDHRGDFEHGSPIKYVIYNDGTYIVKERKSSPNHILSFPTPEMQDAFYEAFQKEIEICKELL